MNNYTQEEMDKAISEVVRKNNVRWSKEMMNEKMNKTAEELIEDLQ